MDGLILGVLFFTFIAVMNLDNDINKEIDILTIIADRLSKK